MGAWMTAMGVVAPGSVAAPHVLVRRNHYRSRYGILLLGREMGRRRESKETLLTPWTLMSVMEADVLSARDQSCRLTAVAA